VKITIVSFQRQGSTDCDEAIADYVRRLQAHVELELHQIRKWSDDTGVPAKLLERSRVIGLYIEGKSFSSEGLAQRLQQLMNGGHSSLVFVIGAADGMPRLAAQQVQERWSLSSLTFPHQVTRLLVVEALYRSFDILHGGKYHK
jgi:23S rRNA (pseudouridine1915-N3)-methyltransferase